MFAPERHAHALSEMEDVMVMMPRSDRAAA
jgi:hypothetical protein